MRIHAIACAAISLVAAAGCSGELAQRTALNDPTSSASAEAAFTPPAAYRPDPLVNPNPPKGAEPSPTTSEPMPSPPSPPPGNPPLRAEPGAPPPATSRPERPDHGSMPGMNHQAPGASRPPAAKLYVCPMHPEVRSTQPGKCPKCGMTLNPSDDKAGAP